MQTQLFSQSAQKFGENRFVFKSPEGLISGIIGMAAEKLDGKTGVRGRIEEILSLENLEDDKKVDEIVQLLTETFDVAVVDLDNEVIAEIRRAIRYRLASCGQIKFKSGEDVREHTYGL